MKILILSITLILSFPIFASETSLNVSGCSPSDYIFNGNQTVRINIVGNSYSPKCLAILPGTQVSITANGFHPLSPQGQSGNPIRSVQADATFRFQNLGTFGYFCPRHGNANGQGMAGAIKVIRNQ